MLEVLGTIFGVDPITLCTNLNNNHNTWSEQRIFFDHVLLFTPSSCMLNQPSEPSIEPSVSLHILSGIMTCLAQ